MFTIKFEEDGFYLYEDGERVLELPPVATRYNLIYSILDAIINRSLRKDFSFETDKKAEYLRQAFICLVSRVDSANATKELQAMSANTKNYALVELEAVKRFLDDEPSFKTRLHYFRMEDDEYLSMQYASDDSDVPADDAESDEELNEIQRAAGIADHLYFLNKKSSSRKMTTPERTHQYTPPAQKKHNYDALNDAMSQLSLDKNRENANEKVQALINDKAVTKKPVYIPGYRAVNYMASRYSRFVRREFRRKDLHAKRMTNPSNHANKGAAYFSESVLQTHMDFYQDAPVISQIFDKSSDLYRELLQTAQTLQEQLLNLRNADFVLAIGISSGDSYYKIFNNFVDCLQHIYSNRILKLQRALRYIINEDMDELNFELPNAYNPFVSESEEPYHALKYGFGLKPLYERAALRPSYDKNGRPRFPYLGEIQITLRDLSAVTAKNERHHIRSSRISGFVEPAREIAPELEATAIGYLPEGEIAHSEVLKCPNFTGEYKKKYQHEFGLSERLFRLFKNDLQRTKPGTEERASVEQHILQWLCSYHSVRLLELTYKIVAGRDGILQFLDINKKLTDAIPREAEVRKDVDAIDLRLKLAKKLNENLKSDKKTQAAKKIFDHHLTSNATQIYAISEKDVRDALSELGFKKDQIQNFIDNENRHRTALNEKITPRSDIKRKSTTPKSSPYQANSSHRERSLSPGKPNDHKERIFEKLATLFAKSFDFKLTQTNLFGLVQYDVPFHVGDCLFEAIAAAVPGQQGVGIRQLAVGQINRSALLRDRINAMRLQADNALRTINGDITFNSVAHYLQLMAAGQTWGTQIEIVALMQVLRRPIVLITPGNQHDEVIGLEQYPNAAPIFLNYVNNNHYQPLALPSQGNALVIIAQIQARQRASQTPSVAVPVIKSSNGHIAAEKPTSFSDSDDLAEVMERLFKI